MAAEDEKLEHTIGRFMINLIPPVVALRETIGVDGAVLANKPKVTFKEVVGYADLFGANLGMVFFLALYRQGVLPADTLNTIFHGYLVERVAVAMLGTVFQAGRDPKTKSGK